MNHTQLLLLLLLALASNAVNGHYALDCVGKSNAYFSDNNTPNERFKCVPGNLLEEYSNVLPPGADTTTHSTCAKLDTDRPTMSVKAGDKVKFSYASLVGPDIESDISSTKGYMLMGRLNESISIESALNESCTSKSNDRCLFVTDVECDDKDRQCSASFQLPQQVSAGTLDMTAVWETRISGDVDGPGYFTSCFKVDVHQPSREQRGLRPRLLSESRIEPIISDGFKKERSLLGGS